MLPWVAGMCLPGFCNSATLTQSVSIQLAPAAKLMAPASIPLIAAGAGFQPFFGTLILSYRVRTPQPGSGVITLQVTSDFSPQGGPSAATGALMYECRGGTLGVPCSGLQAAGTSGQSPVINVPPGACTGDGGGCSGQDPNFVELNFTLTNESTTATGSYSAQITFVISAI